MIGGKPFAGPGAGVGWASIVMVQMITKSKERSMIVILFQFLLTPRENKRILQVNRLGRNEVVSRIERPVACLEEARFNEGGAIENMDSEPWQKQGGDQISLCQ